MNFEFHVRLYVPAASYPILQHFRLIDFYEI